MVYYHQYDGKPPQSIYDLNTFFLHYTLKRKSTTSPSRITYSLPSLRTSPFSLAAAILPQGDAAIGRGRCDHTAAAAHTVAELIADQAAHQRAQGGMELNGFG